MRRVLAGMAVLALLLGGCTKTDVPPVPPLVPQPAAPQGEILIRGCTPERPLLPAATLGPCGLEVVDAINGRLVRPNPADGQPVLDLATAIETQDSQHFTVRLARDRHFHDGTEVRARNFVSAWNWAAYGPNNMPAQTWFTLIEGGSEMNCPVTGPCSKDDRPTRLSGLSVVDDYTFTITTVRPIVDLQARLGHPVFSPLPDAFFAEDEGKDAFGRLPVGTGPFRVDTNTNTEITLAAFDGYTGDPAPKVATVRLKKYDDPARDLDVFRAYNDVVANNLDFTDVIPTDVLVDDVWQEDLGGRSGFRDTQTLQELNFVATDPLLADPRVRQAISMAIDREALARQVFAGTRVRATSWVSPAVPGYRADACGELCTYDLSRARTLFREGGGYAGEFVVTVNADGGHKQWADALCNQLKNALDLDCQVNLLPSQEAVLQAAQKKELTGAVRQGWTAIYPSAEASLRQFRSDSRLNLVGYANAAFDARLEAALEATSQTSANAAYREAELLLQDDPPSVPLWFASTPYGYSNRITGVRLTPSGTLDLLAVRRT
ncbi:peptide ABC transporter substrate-binding protein [Granulicoccus sp. GXG6511]|uniref:peptide ABC transporter substrate-binding protein n=1 Tax=Granulicoccus sp. GXG6511 TaxID=3381351 RepID=UPI003D7D274A